MVLINANKSKLKILLKRLFFLARFNDLREFFTTGRKFYSSMEKSQTERKNVWKEKFRFVLGKIDSDDGATKLKLMR